MAKPKVVSNSMSKIACEYVRFEWIHINVDSYRPFGADSANTGGGGLTILVAVTTPVSRNENKRHKILGLE